MSVVIVIVIVIAVMPFVVMIECMYVYMCVLVEQQPREPAAAPRISPGGVFLEPGAAELLRRGQPATACSVHAGVRMPPSRGVDSRWIS